MPRGLPPTLNVAVTLSVAVSITDTVPDPSFEAKATGAATASVLAVDNAAATMRSLICTGCDLRSNIEPAAMEPEQSIGYATRLAATAELATDANPRPLRRTPA